MELPENLQDEIRKTVESEGLELVHIGYGRHGRAVLLRVDIDKEGGVTLDDCELISRQLSAWLDVEDAISSKYDLQVSSPGLDRLFYSESDYEKFKGNLVRVKTSKMIGGLHVIVGHLVMYDGETVRVVDPKTKKQKEYEIPMRDIIETRLEPDF